MNKAIIGQHCVQVNEAVNKLVANWCPTKVNNKPYLCSPLMFIRNATGTLNLKYSYQFLNTESFKYKDLLPATAKKLILSAMKC